jgi:two-component system alkaline phosphatase synthesis response regulator PhoP
MPRVLIVEDDPAMAVALRDGFEAEGHSVTVANDGESGLRAAREETADILILDVMLPKLSGHDVCRALRAEGARLPIIMLTARGQEIDKVVGLKLGADDYITKPFSFMELLARVEAVLRRSRPPTGGGQVSTIGDIEADFRAGEVRKAGVPVELSARELRLWQYFVDHPGEVISRDTLLDEVWDYDEPPLTRTVDVHVAKLRKKLEDDPADPKLIVTVHRMGYKLVVPI